MTDETHNAATLQGITISGIQDGVLVCQDCDEAFASCDADPLCPDCREEEERSKGIFEAVIALLAQDYPGTVEYEVRPGNDGDMFDLLDEDDQVIDTISEQEMTHAWNLVEGGAQ